MKSNDLAVQPIQNYDKARYPHQSSKEAEAVRQSLGSKIGAVMLVATIGVVLVSGCDSGRRVGPPPVRADFKTEDDARQAIEQQTNSHSQTK